MKFAEFGEWMRWYILWKFEVGSSLFFLTALYHIALKTKVDAKCWKLKKLRDSPNYSNPPKKTLISIKGTTLILLLRKKVQMIRTDRYL